MIRLWTENYLPPLPLDWQGTYVSSRFAAYGANTQFAPFYADEKGSILSVLDGNAVLCGEDTHTEEWAVFLCMQPDIFTVCTAWHIAEKLAAFLKKPVTNKKVMRLQSPLLPPDISLVHPSPRQMYPLLSEAFGETMPAFDNWYVDVSHRIRHGICQTAGVERDGKLVSTAMTVAQSDTAAIIGAVATAAVYRKQGMASQCLRELATAITAENDQKAVMISPKNSGAEKLYASMGFTVCGEIGEIQLKE